jgi:pimeloyl-ACP methyl ester carboxylesterase
MHKAKYIKLGNISFHYEVIGQGLPLIFLNGLGMTLRDWEFQTAYFSKDYRVVTFDFRGQGFSDRPPGPYSVSLFCEDAARLLRAIDAWPAHVVGLSMGGMIAFQMAVSHPELLRSMVIVNSGPELILRTWTQKFEFLKRTMIVRFLGMRKMAEILACRLFPENRQKALRREMLKRWGLNDKKAYNDTLRALAGWSVSEHLGGIACPTLVISADRDYSPVSYKLSFVNKMPRAEMAIISNSRHATPLDQPERFNELVADFLNRFS